MGDSVNKSTISPVTLCGGVYGCRESSHLDLPGSRKVHFIFVVSCVYTVI